MNKLYSELGSIPNSNNTGIQNLKSVMKKLQTLQNPTKELEIMMNENPSIKEVLNLAQKQNVSLKDLYYFLAKQQNIDPNEILNQLK